MKYLYVLTSNENDYYLEQTLLSITSLRLHMPNAFISLLVDNETETTLSGKRRAILDLVNEFKSITIDPQFNQKARSRWLKTSMRQYIDDDFLYIDGDTIIADDLSDIVNIDMDIGAVLDSHIYLSEKNNYFPIRLKNIKAMCPKFGITPEFDLNVYFNGGIMFCRNNETGHRFFREWHRLWLKCYELGSLNDQSSLNLSNFVLSSVIKELDGIWNCQILDDGALRFLYNAKIIHYFSSRPGEKVYLPANDNFLDRIKKNGFIEQNILDLIKTPKTLFAPNTRLFLVDKSFHTFYDSAFCGISKRLYNTKIGKAIEHILFKIRRNIYIPHKRKFSKR
ncbi:MAG: putative nucleotide-diphospho-sugar transferase [Defluviitaleaceae bacterium]|nr:putative nucleotide-diphospho-sugar transferase [Defluviitaleaceae bacterium]